LLGKVETPGHTPGSITIMAETSHGLVAITGDAIMAREHFVKRKLPKWVQNREQVFKSVDKISFKPYMIVLGHGRLFIPDAEKFRESNSLPKDR